MEKKMKRASSRSKIDFKLKLRKKLLLRKLLRKVTSKHRKEKKKVFHQKKCIRKDKRRKKVLFKRIGRLKRQVKKIEKHQKSKQLHRRKLLSLKKILRFSHSLFARKKNRKEQKLPLSSPAGFREEKPTEEKTTFEVILKKGEREKTATPKAKITAAKSLSHLNLGPYETQIDFLYQLVETRGKISLNEATKKCKISKELAEEWAKILESHELIKITYTTFGSAILIRQAKNKKEVIFS